MLQSFPRSGGGSLWEALEGSLTEVFHRQGEGYFASRLGAQAEMKGGRKRNGKVTSFLRVHG